MRVRLVWLSVSVTVALWLAQSARAETAAEAFAAGLDSWYNVLQEWRSVPASDAGSEDGPKKPSKGTSMKFLVLACYAQ